MELCEKNMNPEIRDNGGDKYREFSEGSVRGALPKDLFEEAIKNGWLDVKDIGNGVFEDQHELSKEGKWIYDKNRETYFFESEDDEFKIFDEGRQRGQLGRALYEKALRKGWMKDSDEAGRWIYDKIRDSYFFEETSV